MVEADLFQPIPGLPGWRAAHLPSTGSTSADLAALAGRGAAGQGRLWFTAGQQTAGRGRRGRPWASPPGNFFGSLLLADPAPADRMGTLPLVAGLAARDAIAGELGGGGPAVTLKWPNDVLVDGAKCCGILLERLALPDGRPAVIAGCGVNIVAHPPDTPYPATHLRRFNARAGFASLFHRLAGAFADALALWARGTDIGAVRARWLDHASGIGGPLTVRLQRTSHTGVFSDIDPDGRLVLRLADDTSKRFAAGDVFFH